MSFVHLHVRSHFSRLGGAASPDALVARASSCKMPALALTDLQTLAGTVPFYQACRAAGIRPIIGMEVEAETGDGLVLLARDSSGYRSLCRIASALGLARRRTPCTLDLLRAEREGLIALAGGRRGRIAEYVRAGDAARAAHLIGVYATLFGGDNFFLELVRCVPADDGLVSELARLAGRLGVPTVATNDALCSVPEEAQTVSLLDAIRTGTTLAAHHPGKAEHVGERYLKTARQMSDAIADYPEALAATGFIARRCELELPLGALRFPVVGLPLGETAFSLLWKLCFAGAMRRYSPLTEEVTARLQYELQTIGSLGFAPYFLIVADIVRWARKQAIPIWGRGSAADSLVAYLLEITQVDPLRHGLYFERFLHAERDPADPPDIDLDISWTGRDAVLNYVYRKYGADNVAMIGTHICFGLRSAWRDVAKAHGLAPEEIAALAGRPWGYDLSEATDEGSAPGAERSAVPRGAADDAWGELYPPTAETCMGAAPDPPHGQPTLDPAVLAGCEALDGRPRDIGIHCGGIVISPFPLTDEVPLQLAAKGIAVTSYDMHAIADLGLIKIDLLGSRALAALAATVARVRSDGEPLDLEAIPPDDPATLAMLAAGATLGVFQLESPGMRALLQIMRPRSLSDLIAAVSLFRPGPLEGGLKDTFLKRLRTGEQPEYPHPAMEEILAPTHGVIIYQEQFLMLVHELAGLDLAAAEQMRKAVAKAPGPEALATYRAIFIAGAIGNDIPRPVAERIWEVLVGYSGFGFCKGHAASYAVIAYRMAYCKSHHPAELLAAVLDNVAGFYPPTVYIEEARRLGITLLGPDVNASTSETLARRRTIQIGLDAVRGLRRDTVAMLLEARRELGPFRSLEDLLRRVPMSKQEITALIQVGALDHMLDEQAHPALLWMALLWLPVIARQRERGASTPPGATYPLPLEEPLPDLPPDMPPLRPYSRTEELAFEQHLLGFTVRDNPLVPYAAQLARYGAVPAQELASYGGESVVVGGFVVAARRHLTRGGGWMLFLTLQDRTDLLEVVVMPDVYQAAGAVVAAGGPLVVRGQVEISAHGGAVVRARNLRSLRPPVDQPMSSTATRGATLPTEPPATDATRSNVAAMPDDQTRARTR